MKVDSEDLVTKITTKTTSTMPIMEEDSEVDSTHNLDEHNTFYDDDGDGSVCDGLQKIWRY